MQVKANCWIETRTAGNQTQDIQSALAVREGYRIYATWKKDWDLMHQTSYWFHCDVAEELRASNLEHYEISQRHVGTLGFTSEAVAHNQGDSTTP